MSQISGLTPDQVRRFGRMLRDYETGALRPHADFAAARKPTSCPKIAIAAGDIGFKATGKFKFAAGEQGEEEAYGDEYDCYSPYGVYPEGFRILVSPVGNGWEIVGPILRMRGITTGIIAADPAYGYVQPQYMNDVGQWVAMGLDPIPMGVIFGIEDEIPEDTEVIFECIGDRLFITGQACRDV